MLSPIPQPPTIPFLGNLNDIDIINSVASFMRLAETYGPIFKLNLGGQDRIFINSHALLDEVCDENRFVKKVVGAIERMRDIIQDGLFTAYHGEHNWEIAHRILMPACGPVAVRSMFDEMHDIASQMVLKWARYGSTNSIKVTDDFTRLTLDSIALCTMDKRFNSFYKDELNPFVTAMVDLLLESSRRSSRPAFISSLMRSANHQWNENTNLLHKVANEVLAERRACPSEKNDLLNAMINGHDPKTGEGMTNESITNNIITFLIAANPTAYKKVQEEVDEVVGKGPVSVNHIGKLPYISACLRESLRLQPTSPVFSLQPRPNLFDVPTVIGGKYEIAPGQTVIALLTKIHRDPAVWGIDADEFKPERMLDENFNKLPRNAWKPFGNGMRGCIGRPFAWQETLLAVCLLFQYFDFAFVDPDYQLSIKQTLTIKPKDLSIYAKLRPGIDVTQLDRNLHTNVKGNHSNGIDKHTNGSHGSHIAKKSIYIFYGSNTGTCEGLAQSLAVSASQRGYSSEVASLDSAANKVPKGTPVIIITASYDGEPPDNATLFVAWLQNLRGLALDGVQYSVFGCGHRDWHATFQRIPTLIATLFQQRGAKCLASRGMADAALGDIFNEFDKWEDCTLWPGIAEIHGEGDISFNENPQLDLAITTQLRSSNLQQNVTAAKVLENRLLTAKGEPPKRHIFLKLPPEMTYKSGDYLAVLAVNNSETVRRVMKRFSLPRDSAMTIKSKGSSLLPTGRSLSVFEVLGTYVELSQPASSKNILIIANTIGDNSIRAELELQSNDRSGLENPNQRTSVLDFLERYPMANLSFGQYLAMLPPLRVRQYSISSSPLEDSSTCTLTLAVLGPEAQANGQKFLGVASSYLSLLEPGEMVQVSVKPSHQGFHPPSDLSTTPLVMACAGTGLAPFRAFVQERAKRIENGGTVASALLFIGCNHSTKDVLYREDFEKWHSMGAVDVRYAYSHEPDKSDGCRFVQERLWVDRKDILDLFDKGARMYVCGATVVGAGVKQIAKRIYKEIAEQKCGPKTDEDFERWFVDIRKERYAVDIFT
ncbi:MAG: hypothetical protein M1827_006610 [Pycnora praestabilis]|nr:MAG: hypothetical protein M1827_006610 [Pycnora praestabilis]